MRCHGRLSYLPQEFWDGNATIYGIVAFQKDIYVDHKCLSMFSCMTV